MVHVQTSIGLQRAALVSIPCPDLRALVLPGSNGASGCGIWEELKSNCVAQSGSCVQLLSRVLRSTLLQLFSHNSDSQLVNTLPKSIVVLLFIFVAVAML